MSTKKKNQKSSTKKPTLKKEPVKLTDQQIKCKIIAYNECLYREKDRHDKNVKNLRDKIREVQKMMCSHPSSSFHSDPSGGRDSYYECDVCGGVVN